jgi:hypothetical protein
MLRPSSPWYASWRLRFLLPTLLLAPRYIRFGFCETVAIHSAPTQVLRRAFTWTLFELAGCVQLVVGGCASPKPEALQQELHRSSAEVALLRSKRSWSALAGSEINPQAASEYNRKTYEERTGYPIHGQFIRLTGARSR